MQKKLCLGLGVVLFGLAALLFVDRNAQNDSDFRIVQKIETKMIRGGGDGGVNYVQGTCGNRTSGNAPAGCTVENVYSTGPKQNGELGTAYMSCGAAACGVTPTATRSIE